MAPASTEEAAPPGKRKGSVGRVVGALTSTFTNQLDAGDYGQDDVRSLPLHVLIFTSIFFAVIDSYIFIYEKASAEEGLGPGMGRVVAVSMYIARHYFILGTRERE